MPKTTKTRDRNFQRVEFRPGIGNFPGFAGMNRQLDPGAIPPNQFYTLQNARVVDGMIVERPGQEKVWPNAATGAIYGVWDDGNGEIADSLLGQIAVYGAASIGPDGMTFVNKIFSFDASTGLFTANDTDVPGTAHFAAVVHDGATSYFAVHNNDGTVGLYKSSGSILSGTYTLLHTIPVISTGTANIVGSMFKDDSGLLWIGVSSYTEPGVSVFWRVYTYNESTDTLTEDDAQDYTGLATTVAPFIALDHNNNVIAVGKQVRGSSEPTEAKARARSSGGIWSDIALPTSGSAYQNFDCTDIVVFSGTTYIGGSYIEIGTGQAHMGAIMSWNGTVLADARTIGENRLCKSLKVFNSKLYFYSGGVNPFTEDKESILGVYDGVTWTNSHKDFSADFGSNAGDAGSLGEVDSNLVLLVRRFSTTTWDLYLSDGTNTSGTWTLQDSSTVIGLNVPFPLSHPLAYRQLLPL